MPGAVRCGIGCTPLQALGSFGLVPPELRLELVDAIEAPLVPQALHEVHARGAMPEISLVRRSSLEDVFLRLTGRSLVE